MGKRERQSNVELLRIIAIMGVVVLHYNNPRMGGGITFVNEDSLNFYVLYFLESLFDCAVNVFILITGFFMCENRKASLWRPIELIIQVILFREALYFISVILHTTEFSLKSAIITLIPTNYFVILYCVIYLFSPYINTFIESINEHQFRVFVLAMVIVFSLITTVVDVLGELRGATFVGLSPVGMYGSQYGYTIVNFFMMYIIGAYIKKGYSIIQKQKTKVLLLLLALCVVSLTAWARINDKTGFFTERSAWEYCNPVIVLETIIIFSLFLRSDIGCNKCINKFAEATFTVFLLHSSFIPFFRIQQFVNNNSFVMLIHLLFCVIIVYFVCWIVHLLYHWLTDPVFMWLKKTLSLPVIEIVPEKGVDFEQV